MRSLHRALHTERVVIVQPTVYGTDNSCTLDAIKQIGSGARGIAVISDRTSNAELDRMHRGGIRGIRIHVDPDIAGPLDPEFTRQQFKAAVDRIKGRDWHVEVVASQLAEVEALREEVMASAVAVSFDLFGGAQPSLGVHQPGFDTLLSLLHGGKAYVNVSGPYRISKQAPDYPDVAPLAKALIAANPRRIIWGSDWPHSRQIPGHPVSENIPLFQIYDGRDLNRLAIWTSSAAQLKLILVENPAGLYGF
jgi:predicted TIM-barrel fold metal-dependent hydrolase